MPSSNQNEVGAGPWSTTIPRWRIQYLHMYWRADIRHVDKHQSLRGEQLQEEGPHHEEVVRLFAQQVVCTPPSTKLFG
jgi:hypothetical protein